MGNCLFEGERVIVTRFACGRCKTEGPCFQITGVGYKAGDYVIVHREDAKDVSKAMLKEVGLDVAYPEDPGL